MSNQLKAELDIHGVIDTFPEHFKHFSTTLYKDGAEVDIITRIKRDANIERPLSDTETQFTHYLSIAGALETSKENRDLDPPPKIKD